MLDRSGHRRVETLSSRKNPHIDQASDEQLAALLEGRAPELRQVYLEVHRLVLETLPDVAYSTDITDGMTGYGARQYGYDGWGMGALAAHKKWVSLMLFRGAHLDDPDNLLEGTGKNMRHVKVRSLDQLNEYRDALRALIEQASRFNETKV